MDEKDLEAALDAFADDLGALISYWTNAGDNKRALQCIQAQAGLRTAASIIGASDLVAQFNQDKAAIQTLTDATNTLNSNADKITQEQKNVSMVVGILNAATEIVGALSPFKLSAVLQGFVDLKGAATI